MIRRTVILGALAVAACTSAAPPPVLPTPGSELRVRDPITVAGQNAGTFFRSPQPNQPAAAARAIADIEFLAGALPADQRWASSSSLAQLQLNQARAQARSALGIPRAAPAQGVIDGLMAAATALDANDRAAVARALPRGIFTAGPDQTVRRLSQPPRMPSAAAALGSVAAGPGPALGR